MSYPTTFPLTLIPVPTGLYKSSLQTGLAPSGRQALCVSHQGDCRDFSGLDDPRSISFEDAEWALLAKYHGNDMPMIAIINAFRDQILGRIDQLWTVHCDRAKLLKSSLKAVAFAMLPLNRANGPGTFYETAIQKVEEGLASTHENLIEGTYLSLHNEALRNVVHRRVNDLRVARNRHPERAAALDLDIPYLRVVQLLSLAGPANPDGPMPASDALAIAPAILSRTAKDPVVPVKR